MQFKIEREIKEIDLVALSRDKLADLKLYVQTQKDGIESGITQHKQLQRQAGLPNDNEWLGRANYALKLRRREIQAIDNEFSRRKRRQSKDFTQAFIDQARRLLSEDVFENIKAAAHDMVEDQHALERAQQL